MESPALLTLLNRRKYVEDRLFRSVQRLFSERKNHDEKRPLTTEDLIEQCLAVVRSRAGLHRQRNRHEAITLEIQTLDSVLQWVPPPQPALYWITENDVFIDGLNEILELNEKGNKEEVKSKIKNLIKFKKNELSKNQSRRAKQPRPNAMSRILDSLVEKNPKISERDTIEEIRKMVGNGVIYEVTEKCVEMDPEEYTNEYGKKIYKQGKSILLSSIRTRLSEAKKRSGKRIYSG
jgi:hypothetical protein